MKRTTLKATAVGLSLLIGVGTTVAVRGFFDRPGESALALIPASAGVIVTEDLVPAPNQIIAFRNIQKAIESAGIKGASSNPIGAELGDPDLLKAVGPYMGRSMAVALFFNNPDPKPNGPTLFLNLPGIVFVSLKDPVAASAAMLGQKLSPGQTGFEKLSSGKFARISGGYLEVATSQKFFSMIDDVKSGKLKSINSLQKFGAAKALVDGAANLKLYVQNTGTQAWAAVTGTVKDSGVQVLVYGAKGSMAGFPVATKITGAKPVSVSSLQRIPSDPYLLFSVSQIGPILSSFASDLGPYHPLVTSALAGDAIIGLYPSEKAPTAGVDVLIVLGANNGAKPHAAFKELRQKLEEQYMNGEAACGSAVKIGHVNTYRLTGQLAGMVEQMSQSKIPNVKSNILFKDKTLAYANDGETLYICTSERLLRRAIATAAGNSPSVARDASFLPFVQGVDSGSQLLLDVNVPRILDGIVNSTTKGNASLAKAIDDIGVATNKDAIVNINGGARPDGSCHARLFVPLNYAKLAKIVGQIQQG